MLAIPSARTTQTDDRVEWDIVDEHLDEADFLLGAFVRTLDSPVQCLAQLAEHPEEPLLNHLDALIEAGPLVLEQRVSPALEEASVDAPMRVAAAAMVAIATQACDALWPALDGEHREIRDALVMAARLAGGERFDEWLQTQLAKRQATQRRVGLLELAAARQLRAPNLMEWFQDDDSALVAATARAARHGDRSLYAPVMEYLLDHPAQDVRDAALVASLAWGSARAWNACERAALDPATTSSVACELYVALGGSEQHHSLSALLSEPAARARTLRALGFSGNGQVVPCLLGALRSDSVRDAKLAAEALSMILGIDLLDSALTVAELLEDGESLPALEDEELSVDLASGPEDELPRPNAEAIERACAVRLAALKQRTSLLEGTPYSSEQVLRSLERGPLGRRHLLALAYGIRTDGASWLDTRALSQAQQLRMASLRALSPRMHHGPYFRW